MAIALVQGKGGTSSPQSYASNNTAGNLLIAIGEANSALGLPTDSQSNSGWANAVKIEDAATTFIYIWYCPNCKAGANTVTVSGALNLVIAEFSGAATSSVTDGSSTNIVSSAATSQTSGSATTTQAGDLLIGAIDDGNGVNPTPSGGFATIANAATMNTSYLVQGSAGSIAATWTTASGIAYDAIMAAFKAAGGGGAAQQRLALLGCGS